MTATREVALIVCGAVILSVIAYFGEAGKPAAPIPGGQSCKIILASLDALRHRGDYAALQWQTALYGQLRCSNAPLAAWYEGYFQAQSARPAAPSSK